MIYSFIAIASTWKHYISKKVKRLFPHDDIGLRLAGLEPTRSSMSWSEYLTSAQEEDTSSRLTRDQENTNMAVTDLQQPEKVKKIIQ